MKQAAFSSTTVHGGGKRRGSVTSRGNAIEPDDVVNYCFPKDWPSDRERRARVIGEWLKTEGPRPEFSRCAAERRPCSSSK